MQESGARTVERMAEQRKQVMEKLGRIRSRIAVMSGKGGVGKTTVAVNLAALLAESSRVGLLDADIDCPNVNRFLGIKEKFRVAAGNIFPVEKYGMKVVSMASLQDSEEAAIIWRGPMISHAILQFLGSAEWGELDYLFIDTPPGTSDAVLTLMQLVRLDGIIVVSTPHSTALTDAMKTINTARMMNAPVIGLVENMAGEIFGSGAVEKLSEASGVPFLGSIPLNKAICETAENGVPAVKAGSNRADFERIAGKLLLHQQKD